MSTITKRLPLIELPVPDAPRGVGVVEVLCKEQKKLLPLASVEIKARVAERIASVTVEQLFTNNFEEHLEAVYIFPLSGGCVVSRFEMRVGKRVIKGIVEERAAARIQYQQALQEGKKAALLEQERDDVFTMQVGNIPPGEQVWVSLTYCERLSFLEDGTTELRLPLVVGERYMPGQDAPGNQVGVGTHCDTDIVKDASRISPPLLAQGFDPKVHLKITVEIATNDAGIRQLCCSQHAVQTKEEKQLLTVELACENERLNRDFVLRWRSAADTIRSSLVVHHGDDGDYGMLCLLPPRREGYLGAARDVVFLLDRSGSMQGMKMVSAARACSLLLDSLGPSDRFGVCTFDSIHEWLRCGRKGHLVVADEANIEAAKQALREVSARGGTELFTALNECLHEVSQLQDREARIPVIVLLTDGQIGDESRILKLLQTDLGDARLFTVGVDTAVNSGFLRRLADLGGGTSSFASPGQSLEAALGAIAREIGQPLVTDISVSADNGLVDHRAGTGDLFAGRALTMFVKLDGKSTLLVQGKHADGSQFSEKIKPVSIDLPEVAQLWAKSVIRDLEDKFRVQPNEQIKKQIVELAVKHSLLCKFTAFVAVDEAEVAEQPPTRRQIVQPVEQAEGWAMYQHAPLPAAMPLRAGMPQVARQAMRFMGRAQHNVTSAANSVNEAYGAADALSLQPGSYMPESAAGAASSYDASTIPSTAIPPATNASSGYGDGLNALLSGNVDLQTMTEIESSLRLFKQALEEAFAAIEKGEKPNTERLCALRKSLMNVLSKSQPAAGLPILQTFLRSSAKELINSLRQPDVQPSQLQALWRRHMAIFSAVEQEVHKVVSATSDQPGAAFWESTV